MCQVNSTFIESSVVETGSQSYRMASNRLRLRQTFLTSGSTTSVDTNVPHLGDIGVTMAKGTDKLRISNTFRVEDFEIDGLAIFSDFFSLDCGAGAT